MQDKLVLRVNPAGTSVATAPFPMPLPRTMKSTFLLLFVLACPGCGDRGARTPAEAHARLQAAVAAHDGGKLWSALDQDTHWSWMTIQRAWRECYDITQSVVPEGPERSRLLARFEPGATAENAKALFIKMLTPDDWALAQTLLTGAGTRVPEPNASGETGEIATPARQLAYHRAHNRFWGWGFTGLATRAAEFKRMASADLERMRTDAADYERAATRGAW
jgi:hypothetical protein